MSYHIYYLVSLTKDTRKVGSENTPNLEDKISPSSHLNWLPEYGFECLFFV